MNSMYYTEDLGKLSTRVSAKSNEIKFYKNYHQKHLLYLYITFKNFTLQLSLVCT